MRPKKHAQPGPGGCPVKIEVIIPAYLDDDNDETYIPQMHWRPKTAEQIEKEKTKFDFKIDRIRF